MEPKSSSPRILVGVISPGAGGASIRTYSSTASISEVGISGSGAGSTARALAPPCGLAFLGRDEITGETHVLVVGLHHLLEEATDLGLPAKPPYLGPTTASRVAYRDPFGGLDPVGAPRYAIPVIVLRIREGQDGFVPDRLDQADTENRRRKASGGRHAPWSDLRGSPGDGSILDLRPPELTGEARSDPDADQDVVWTSPPVPGVAPRAGTIVEDGAESLPCGEGSLEGGVSSHEDPKLFRGKTRERAIENISIVRRLREKAITCHQTHDREKSEPHGLQPANTQRQETDILRASGKVRLNIT